MLDKAKVATLVRAQSPMPKLPAVAAKPKPNLPATTPAAKPKPKPAVNADDMTPQEMAALVEEAAQAAEGQQDPAIEDLLVDYMHGDTSQPPEWAKNPELWAKAMDAVGIGGTAEERYEEPYAVVAYLYKQLGGPIPSSEEHEAGESPGHEAAEGASAEGKEHGAPPAAGAKKPALAVKAAMGGAKKGVGNPAPQQQPPAGGPAGEGQAPGGDLKQMLDAAAQQAQTNPDPELAEKLAGYNPERDGNPPQWATDADKWAKAEAAVKPHWDEYPEPYAVVAHVYKNMGGTVQ